MKEAGVAKRAERLLANFLNLVGFSDDEVKQLIEQVRTSDDVDTLHTKFDYELTAYFEDANVYCELTYYAFQAIAGNIDDEVIEAIDDYEAFVNDYLTTRKWQLRLETPYNGAYKRQIERALRNGTLVASRD
jgi:hypothetical protein